MGEKCVCRFPQQAVKPCSTGLSFDIATCSCINQEETDTSNFISDERFARSEDAVINYERTAELIIISTLSGVAIVCFMIIISLLNTIRNLRHSIRNIRVVRIFSNSDLLSHDDSSWDENSQEYI